MELFVFFLIIVLIVALVCQSTSQQKLVNENTRLAQYEYDANVYINQLISEIERLNNLEAQALAAKIDEATKMMY